MHVPYIQQHGSMQYRSAVCPVGVEVLAIGQKYNTICYGNVRGNYKEGRSYLLRGAGGGGGGGGGGGVRC